MRYENLIVDDKNDPALQRAVQYIIDLLYTSVLMGRRSSVRRTISAPTTPATR